jgi:hypothetical protein
MVTQRRRTQAEKDAAEAAMLAGAEAVFEMHRRARAEVTMSAIVKVQLALNDPSALPLVYAEGRKNMVQQSLDATTKRAMGDDVKAFFQAEFRHTVGQWAIGKRVKDRSW